MKARIAKRQVLLMDDDPQRAESIARHLVRHGCRVTLATSVEEALRNLAGQTFDVLFSPLEMRRTTGWILMARCRQRQVRVPVVLLTVAFDAGKWASALVWGAQALLRVPLQDDELANILALVAPAPAPDVEVVEEAVHTIAA
ncbi:MAG: Regulator of RpoS [Verrucomicrobiae bacterium]|nr:Regulator of RpoS [Verrucomicrobiae bacterium]